MLLLDYLNNKETDMSNKEFAMFLQLIAVLLKDGKTDEVLKIIENTAGEIAKEKEIKGE